MFVFRDAAGHVVTRLNQSVPETTGQPACASDAADADRLVRLRELEGGESQLVRVPQTVDGFKTWTYIQFGQRRGTARRCARTPGC